MSDLSLNNYLAHKDLTRAVQDAAREEKLRAALLEKDKQAARERLLAIYLQLGKRPR